MRIAIATAAIGRAYQIACSPGIKSQKRYSQRHGYDFIYQKTSLDPSRTPNWSKIRLVQSLLPKYDWVLWLDADLIIMDLEKPLTNWIDPNYSLIICEEVIGGLNSGVFCIKDTPLMNQFLTEVYGRANRTSRPDSDQTSLREVLDRGPHYQSETKILPQKTINSFAPEAVLHETIDFLPGTYTPGDFLVHFPSMRDPVKLAFLMKKYSMSPRVFQIFALSLEWVSKILGLIHPKAKKAALFFHTKKRKSAIFPL